MAVMMFGETSLEQKIIRGKIFSLGAIGEFLENSEGNKMAGLLPIKNG